MTTEGLPRGPLLVLDTAAPVATVGVVVDSTILHEVRLEETRRHAEALPAAVDATLAGAGVAKRDLVAVVVGRGPGSFVGVRVGLSHAKGFALALSLPLFGVCSLLAVGGEPDAPDGDGLALLDARRGQLYARPVRRAGGRVSPLGPALAVDPDRLGEVLRAPAFLVGNFAGLVSDDAFPDASRHVVLGSAAAGIYAASLADEDRERDLGELVPNYCRAPDAKLPDPR